ncbi:MAG: 4'-phosphopantetheinyl transferase superfamily protein [Scytonematopsis contorta HA4267-MV1]|jgi:4'-phosphopantetheinyl transferase|nr:4'-phosphopantetheinyl transferase superfamily protein [Scytonematopsis contorta HA4267-MV1]
MITSNNITLAKNEVHIWQAALEVNDIQSLQQNLSIDEVKRAERFRFQKDRENFIIARGFLRKILSRYLGVLPRDLCFCYGANGKPALTKAFDGDKLKFNLSHSHGIALYAITLNRNIGIDIERIRTDFDCEQIAQQFFSPRENAILAKLPTNTKHEAFFSCWTRKEAYIKANGQGLSLPLEQIDVTLIPGEPAALLNTKWDSQEAKRWSLKNIVPHHNYAAAVAVEKHLNVETLHVTSPQDVTLIY